MLEATIQSFDLCELYSILFEYIVYRRRIYFFVDTKNICKKYEHANRKIINILFVNPSILFKLFKDCTMVR